MAVHLILDLHAIILEWKKKPNFSECLCHWLLEDIWKPELCKIPCLSTWLTTYSQYAKTNVHGFISREERGFCLV